MLFNCLFLPQNFLHNSKGLDANNLLANYYMPLALINKVIKLLKLKPALKLLWIQLAAQSRECKHMRFPKRMHSLDCTSHWYHCNFTADFNFKSFITFYQEPMARNILPVRLPVSIICIKTFRILPNRIILPIKKFCHWNRQLESIYLFAKSHKLYLYILQYMYLYLIVTCYITALVTLPSAFQTLRAVKDLDPKSPVCVLINEPDEPDLKCLIYWV